MFKLRASAFASEGIKELNAGNYYEAVDFYSRAIQCDPYDYRLYLQRAKCYSKSELFHLAKSDASTAFNLIHKSQENPDLAKCLFYSGLAHAGLEEYALAEKYLRAAIKLDDNFQEAKTELMKIIFSALSRKYGFDKITALEAAAAYNSIREALDALLSKEINSSFNVEEEANEKKDDAGNQNENNFLSYSKCLQVTPGEQAKEVCSENNQENDTKLNADEDKQTEVNNCKKYADIARDWAVSAKKSPPKISVNLSQKRPTNIWNYNGIRVENINSENKKSLHKIFSQFGTLQKVEPMKKSKSSVFVYYDNPNSPVEAIAHLQGAIIGNLNFNGKPLRLFFAPTNEQTELRFSRPKYPPDNKGECYYWRTTFCCSEDKCALLHIPANKHIDAQVWMVTKEGKQIG